VAVAGLAERKFRRNSSWRATLLSAASLQKSDGTKERAGVGKRISEERESSATKEEGVTKVRARGRIGPYIIV